MNQNQNPNNATSDQMKTPIDVEYHRHKELARVAIVGRPNVGKSTLVNRLVGRRVALVHDRPGVTRDRKEVLARIGNLEFLLVDTAGFEPVYAASSDLATRMWAQSEVAIESADIVLFVMDAVDGLTTADYEIAEILRRSEKPVIVLANKIDAKKAHLGATEAYSLGFGDPINTSGSHGEGIRDLFDRLFHLINELGRAHESEPDQTEIIKIAVIGRPNAGKSTLINRLIGEDRLLTGPEAGITRDSIALPFSWEGQEFEIYDTAGMRKRARVNESLEKQSVGDTLNAVKYAHVVVMLMDPDNALEKQDIQLADLAVREGRALVIGMSKWDSVSGDIQKKRKIFQEEIEHNMLQVRGVPFVTVSGLSGLGIKALLTKITEVYNLWNVRIPTGELNRWLYEMMENHPPPLVQGRRLKIRYMTQAKTRPPTFIGFAQKAEEVPMAYERYLINGLRRDFGLEGIPIRMRFKKGHNPYDKRK